MAEQLGTGPFNRGALLNFAFLAAEAGSSGTMAVVDVDMLPLPGVNFSDVGSVSLLISAMAVMSSWPACDASSGSMMPAPRTLTVPPPYF